MTKPLHLTLEVFDVHQLLDGLNARAEEWEMTAYYLDTGYMPDDRFGVLECSNAEEAEGTARHYRELVSSIERQIACQTN